MCFSKTTSKRIKDQIIFRDENDVYKYIFSFTNTEQNLNKKLKRAYRLDRMKILLNELEHPEDNFKSIHIAGTKGKGSTASFIANALNACGIKTGLYTSPHVISPAERISIPGYSIDIKALIASGEEIKQVVDNRRLELEGYQSPTTFELLTALSFLYFKNTECKIAVIETGIGGRLDATNVITPIVSVITPINREHTDILGNTLKKIALEKAGIIKREIPVFSSKQRIEVKRVLLEEGIKRQAPMYFLDEEIRYYNSEISIEGTKIRAKLKDGSEISFTTGMIGDFQAENALLAYLVTKNVLRNINSKDKINWDGFNQPVVQGLKKTRLPGRFEIFPIRGKSNSYIVLDGAHTPVAIRRILKNFNYLFNGKKILIFGAVKGKNYREMAKHLAPHFEYIIISKPNSFKESEPEKIFNFFKELNLQTYLEPNPLYALKRAKDMLTENASPGAILVTGSFYMISEIGKCIKHADNSIGVFPNYNQQNPLQTEDKSDI